MKKYLALCGALALACVPAVAFAAEVAIPTDLVTDLRDVVSAIAAGLVAVILGFVPPWASWAIRVAKVDQLATRAIQNAWFKQEAKILQPDGSYSIEVKNDLLGRALQYSLDTYPSLVNTIGRDKWIAMLQARVAAFLLALQSKK